MSVPARVAEFKEHSFRRKFMGTQVKAIKDDQKVITFMGTTPTPDRDNDIVVPQGCRINNFRANPTFLWAHDWLGNHLPIGKSQEERIIPDKGIEFDIQFDADDPFAMDVYRKYKNGYLNAVSIGFIDLKTEPREGEGPEWSRGRKFLEWELLELSGCPVPANPEALQQMLDKSFRGLEDIIRGDAVILTIRGVCAYADLPTAPKEHAWDGAAAEGRVRKWASSDGTGEKDKMDWPKYRKAFCWYDPDKTEDFTGYKLGIADVIDGSLQVVFRAVAAVMAVLNGGRGGVDIPDADRERVYARHVKPYYAKFDQEAPELRSFGAFVAGLPVVIAETSTMTPAEIEQFRLAWDEQQKHGAVLNRKNKELLATAQANIQEVLDSAEPPDDGDDDGKALRAELEKLGLTEDRALEIVGRSASKPVEPGVKPQDIAGMVADAVEAKLRYLQGKAP